MAFAHADASEGDAVTGRAQKVAEQGLNGVWVLQVVQVGEKTSPSAYWSCSDLAQNSIKASAASTRWAESETACRDGGSHGPGIGSVGSIRVSSLNSSCACRARLSMRDTQPSRASCASMSADGAENDSADRPLERLYACTNATNDSGSAGAAALPLSTAFAAATKPASGAKRSFKVLT